MSELFAEPADPDFDARGKSKTRKKKDKGARLTDHPICYYPTNGKDDPDVCYGCGRRRGTPKKELGPG